MSSKAPAPSWGIDYELLSAHDTVIMETLSTIIPVEFSVLIYTLWNNQFIRLLSRNTFFRSLRGMSRVRPFGLVFLVQFLAATYQEEKPKVETTLASVTTKGHFNFLDSPPIVRMYTYASSSL